MSDFNYKITERIAVLSRSANGDKTLELNRISYNGRAAKLDLRRWEHSGGEDAMRKGITLTDEEAAALKAALEDISLEEDSYGERGGF